MISLLVPHPQLPRTLLLPLRFLDLIGVVGLARRRSGAAAMLPRLGWWEPVPKLVPACDTERHRVGSVAGCVAQVLFAETNLAGDPAYAARAHAFSAKVRDVTEFLATIELVAPTHPIRARVTYHDPCHLAHARGVRDAPRQLLRQIPGLELVELADSDICCGSAGSYNLTEPEMARRLGERKAANIRATGATCVAAANPGGVMQIQAALRRSGAATSVRHPVELLDEAYGGEAGGERR